MRSIVSPAFTVCVVSRTTGAGGAAGTVTGAAVVVGGGGGADGLLQAASSTAPSAHIAVRAEGACNKTVRGRAFRGGLARGGVARRRARFPSGIVYTPPLRQGPDAVSGTAQR
jgi:hypothetical protein